MQLVDHAIEGVWGEKKFNKFVIGEMEKYQITTKLQKWQVSWKFGQLLVLVVLCSVLNLKKKNDFKLTNTLEKYHFFILTWVNMKLIKEKKKT